MVIDPCVSCGGKGRVPNPGSTAGTTLCTSCWGAGRIVTSDAGVMLQQGNSLSPLILIDDQTKDLLERIASALEKIGEKLQ